MKRKNGILIKKITINDLPIEIRFHDNSLLPMIAAYVKRGKKWVFTLAGTCPPHEIELRVTEKIKSEIPTSE